MAGVIKVGVIGAGANTKKFHIPLLQKHEGVEVTHVVNRTRASGQAVADAFGIPHVCDSYEEMLSSDVDAIVIGTWPYKHAEYTIAALQAGKHVMCEARMACDGQQAREMLAASLANPRLTAQIVPSPFSLKWDATVCRLLAEGYLGRLVRVEVRGVVGSTFPDAEGSALHWRQDKALSGNNIMMMGIFYEAMMRWVGEASSVLAMGSVHVKERTRADTGERVPIEIPDDIDIICRMKKDGAQTHMHFSTVCGLAERSMAFWLHGSEGSASNQPPRIQPCSSAVGGAAIRRSYRSTCRTARHRRGEWRMSSSVRCAALNPSSSPPSRTV